MPMIDVYATTGTFRDPHALAVKLAAGPHGHRGGARHPDVPQEHRRLRPRASGISISNVDGDSNYVRVQVLTNAGALDRDKQLAVVERFVDLVAEAAGDEGLKQRTWVLLTEAARVAGGCGVTHIRTRSWWRPLERRSARAQRHVTPVPGLLGSQGRGESNESGGAGVVELGDGVA